jgi:hypothetical protein
MQYIRDAEAKTSTSQGQDAVTSTTSHQGFDEEAKWFAK